MQFCLLLSLFSCLAGLMVVSAAQADVMQFTPDRDNTVYEPEDAMANDLSNGAGSYFFFGRTGPDGESTVRRALLHFDVSAIPPEVIIDNVELSFDIVQAPFQSPTGGLARLHRLTADWGEGGSNAPGAEGQGTAAQEDDATWEHRFHPDELWASPGGDFLAQESASQGYGTDLETLTFTSTSALMRDLQKWVRQPDQNFGWILLGAEGLDFTARKAESREAAGGSPALLTVDYHLQSPTDNLELEPVTSGLASPVVITNAGDGSNRLFIVEQAGRIRIYNLATQTLLATPFLDITALVDDSGNEQGLLGLAFHPDYENNRQFYVNYTYDPPGINKDRTRVAMYQASTGNPNIADTAETPILEFEQDASNHNGGDMHFDPDGYLVIASGDGGGANDLPNNAQSLGVLLGKLLRIDVDTARATEGSEGLCGLVENYAIPPGNPYAGPDEGCDEILHYGLRNPWRFSFDARTGEMFIGDVGQNLWEEVSYAPAGATNINYGWRICEGAHLRGNEEDLCEFGTLPIIEYGHTGGNQSIAGGYVYRGGISSLEGRYFYADSYSARIWIATREGDDWVSAEWMESPSLGFIPTFGQDEQCELYVADFNGGNIYRIVSSEIIDSSGFEELRCQ